MFENSSFDLVRFGEVVAAKETCDPRRTPDLSFKYVDIASVSNERFAICETKNILGKDAPSRARKVIRSGDVIFATTRPYLKSIAIVPSDLDGQICSTGFCVLRPTPKIDPEWVFYCSISDQFMSQIKPLMRGANYPAITDKDILGAYIPLPTVDEQLRIIIRIKECMERVDEIERLRNKATEEVEAITKSILYEIWQSTDIATVKKIALSELGNITTGNTPSRKVPEYFGGRLPWVTPGDFNGRLITTGREFLSKRGISESNARVVPEGSVLVVCIGATIGKIALADCDLGINQQINAVTFNLEKVIPEFGYWACRALVPEIIDNASKNTLPILNKGRFSKLKIPVPNKEAQEKIAVQLNATEAAVSEMRQELLEANAASTVLHESILRKAFAGEL